MARMLTNKSVELTEHHWNLLWHCARIIEKKYHNRVEAGDLVGQVWVSYARKQEDISGLSRFILSDMNVAAQSILKGISHNREKVVADQNNPDLISQFQGIIETEQYQLQRAELWRRIAALNERDRRVVSFYLRCGDTMVVGRRFKVGAERVRQILKLVTMPDEV